MNPKTYQDEIVDPVIRKICDKIIGDDFLFTVHKDINIIFGDTNVILTDDGDDLFVQIDGANYAVKGKETWKLLNKTFDDAMRTFNKKEEERIARIIKNGVKNILEDKEKPYAQRF